MRKRRGAFEIVACLDKSECPITTSKLKRCLKGLYEDEREALPDAIAERIEKIYSRTFGGGVDSVNRIEVMLGLCIGQPPEVFWSVLSETFNSCDDTWVWRGVLLDMLRSQATRPKVAAGSRRVWRGCSRRRVRGLSWTTSRKVAEGFAWGHRFIPVPDPVVAEAIVDESAVFVEIDCRKEQEVLIDPRGLRDLVVRKFTTLPPWAASNALSPEADLSEAAHEHH